MISVKLQKELKEFFIIFGAENNLDEARLEKLERVIHDFNPRTMGKIKKLCNYIAQNGLFEMPEDEIIDALKEAGVDD